VSRRPRALFVTYGGGHVSMILPVIGELERQRPEIDCTLLALTTGHLPARAVRPSTLGYRDFLHLVDAQAAKTWGEQLMAGNTSPDVPTDETIAYLGINYLDLIAQHGPDGAAQVYRTHGRYGFRPMKFMRRVLEMQRPDVVVATNSPRSEQAALEMAREMCVPSVGMVDLFGLDRDMYVTREVKPDWTCVLGATVRARLVARGFEPERVIVTGSPAFDGLFAPENVAAAHNFIAARQWQGLSPVLWCGHIEPADDAASIAHVGRGLALEAEDQLRALVSARRDLALIVRYHPSEWHTFPRKPDQERIHFSTPLLESIHPLILAARVVVVQNSTVGLESAIAGRPVVSLEYSPSVQKTFSLAAMGVSDSCNSPQELVDVVERVLCLPRSVPTEYSSDGHAAQRVAGVISLALDKGDR
jgi:hypothetical protein